MSPGPRFRGDDDRGCGIDGASSRNDFDMNIADAHAFCAALPGATLDYKWRFEDSVHPVFSVGGKMFAMFSMKAERLVDQLLFKAHDDRFLELTDRPGITPSAYLARAKWVTLDRPTRVSDDELRALLTEAHAVIVGKLSKKLQAALCGGTESVDRAATSTQRRTVRKAASPTAEPAATKVASATSQRAGAKAASSTSRSAGTKAPSSTSKRAGTKLASSTSKPASTKVASSTSKPGTAKVPSSMPKSATGQVAPSTSKSVTRKASTPSRPASRKASPS